MIFAAGEKVTFPNTALGRERAREFAASQPGRAEMDGSKEHVVRLLADFVLKPINYTAPKITALPTFAELRCSK